MVSAASRRFLKRYRWSLIAVAVIATLALTVVHLHRQAALRKSRDDLRLEYAQLMREASRNYYLVFSEIPETSSAVAAGNPLLRNPDLLYRGVKLEGDEYRSGEECLLGLEDRAFADVMPISQTLENQWQVEAQALDVLIEQAPSDEDKLRLAVDTNIDFIAVVRHATSLQTAKLADNESLESYLAAASEFRALTLNLPDAMQMELLRHGVLSHVEHADDSEIAAAARRFEDAVSLVLESLADN